jgi:hypothetical protein
MAEMRERFREAVDQIGRDDADYEASLNLTLGVLLGMGMYGCAAAVRRVMLAQGLEVAGLVGALVDD